MRSNLNLGASSSYLSFEMCCPVDGIVMFKIPSLPLSTLMLRVALHRLGHPRIILAFSRRRGHPG
jgi:hypothetical protein